MERVGGANWANGDVANGAYGRIGEQPHSPHPQFAMRYFAIRPAFAGTTTPRDHVHPCAV